VIAEICLFLALLIAPPVVLGLMPETVLRLAPLRSRG
jgi:hypothetical protein